VGQQPKPRGKADRLKPLSLHPLTLEQALSAFMRVNPKKVTKAMERKRQKKQRE
jgi:hypothetical protein